MSNINEDAEEPDGYDITEPLGYRMKSYELIHHIESSNPDPDRCLVVRLDGRKFSTYLRPFPMFDLRLHTSLALVALDLVKEFHADFAARHSDEISVFFFPGTLLPFEERLEKILTLMASRASVVFSREISKAYADSEFSSLREHIERAVPTFDARAVVLPHLHEIWNYIYWRNAFDCTRNATFAWARQHVSEKQLRKVATRDMQQKVTDAGHSAKFSDLPLLMRHGCFVKRYAGSDQPHVRAIYLSFTMDLKDRESRAAQQQLICEQISALDYEPKDFVQIL
jgi:tRNA(His) 5'-end guanylyltransferase